MLTVVYFAHTKKNNHAGKKLADSGIQMQILHAFYLSERRKLYTFINTIYSSSHAKLLSMANHFMGNPERVWPDISQGFNVCQFIESNTM